MDSSIHCAVHQMSTTNQRHSQAFDVPRLSPIVLQLGVGSNDVLAQL